MQLGFVQLPRINSGVPERTKAHGVLARKRLRASETRGLPVTERRITHPHSFRTRDPTATSARISCCSSACFSPYQSDHLSRYGAAS